MFHGWRHACVWLCCCLVSYSLGQPDAGNLNLLGQLMNFGQISQFGNQWTQFTSNLQQNLQQSFGGLAPGANNNNGALNNNAAVLAQPPQQQPTLLGGGILRRSGQQPGRFFGSQGSQGSQPTFDVPVRQPVDLIVGPPKSAEPIKPIVTGGGAPPPPQAQAAQPQQPLGPLSQALKLPQQWDQFVRNDNFGLAKGKGCIPVLGEVVVVLFGRCQEAIDSQQLHAWSSHLNSAIVNGKVDVLKAGRETCKLQAERQHCRQLVDRVATCDILGSISSATALDRAKQRCDKLTLLSLQPPQQPNQLVNQITGFLGSEVAHSLLQNLLSG